MDTNTLVVDGTSVAALFGTAALAVPAQGMASIEARPAQPAVAEAEAAAPAVTPVG